MTDVLRIVYAGTPEFAVPALAALGQTRHRVVAVYTQPDRPAGRGRVLTASPVKAYALAHGWPVEQPLNFKTPEAVARLREWQPDVMVVAAYGLLLPQVVLDIPQFGCINLHASLLPRWRGAAPIQRAIQMGDVQTGVTIMRMAAGLDTGPMISAASVAIGARDTAQLVHDQLATLGAELLLPVLADLPAQLANAVAQPEQGVTYARKLSKEEAQLDWSLSATELDRQVRAFNPWPIAETRLHGAQLRVWQAEPLALTHHAAPGTVLQAEPAGIQVACGSGVLSLTQVQSAGRKAVSAAEFTHSHPDLTGVVLGQPTGTHS